MSIEKGETMKAIIVCKECNSSVADGSAGQEGTSAVKDVIAAVQFAQEHNARNPGHRAVVGVEIRSPSGEVISIPKRT